MNWEVLNSHASSHCVTDRQSKHGFCHQPLIRLVTPNEGKQGTVSFQGSKQVALSGTAYKFNSCPAPSPFCSPRQLLSCRTTSQRRNINHSRSRFRRLLRTNNRIQHSLASPINLILKMKFSTAAIILGLAATIQAQSACEAVADKVPTCAVSRSFLLFLLDPTDPRIEILH